MLTCYSALDHAKYLFVRLCLRKSDQWIPLRKLKYEPELGEHILATTHELCGVTPVKEQEPAVRVKQEETEIIDLTGDDETPGAGPSKPTFTTSEAELEKKPNVGNGGPDYDMWAADASRAELRDLLDCLQRDELSELTKTLKLTPKDTKVLKNLPYSISDH